MAKQNNSKPMWIWLSVLILFVCVAATAVALTNIMNSYLLDDSGAISLISDSELSGTNDSFNANHSGTTQEITNSTNPGFEASDDNTVWSTNTQVEIFRVSYENGEQKITVQSSDSDKVIAPGTENSYTFKLKNTGNVALDYTVEVDAYFTPSDIEIPITARLNRYDGKWVVGNGDAYASVSVLDKAGDTTTLGAGKYTYYTLDWLWPFESENDELDTSLGDMAGEKDLTFTLVIKTTATESSNPDDNSGITPPDTGDNFSEAVWIVVATGSFVMMLLLLFYQKKDKQRKNAEAETVEKS